VHGQDCYSYILIGLTIRILRNVAKDDTKDFVSSTLDVLKKQLEVGNFEVTLAAMESISFSNMEDSIAALKSDTTVIGHEIANTITEEFSSIENVVFSESSIKKIYILPSRRFNTDYLLNKPDKLFAKGVFEKLDDIAQHDIRSSCRCLLFGEATASAFHILRAVESVLKYYYFHHKRQNRLSKPMWANMVEQLKAKTRKKPPETLLNTLDLIRSAYRNPTQHPQATYDIDSAQDLFGVCLDVIGKMGSEL